MRKKTRNPVLKERCPICKKYDNVGDQGYGRFFCCECSIEFKKTPMVDGFMKMEIFVIESDGKQTLIDDYAEKDGVEYSINQHNQICSKL